MVGSRNLDARRSLADERKRIQEIQNRLSRLTAREWQVLGLVVSGLANKQIATKLKVSIRTVEVHRAHIMRKMEVQTPIELACSFQCANCAYFDKCDSE
jgi:two-component system response regulator DctR